MAKVANGVFTEKQLEDFLVESEGISKAAANRIVGAIKSKIAEETALGKRVELTNLVTFEGRTRAERPGRNPQTGEAITIPAKLVVKAKAAAKLNAGINANEQLRADYL